MNTQNTSATPGTASTRTVVTRFAPSPTGFLHIGGARTALFNWLLARHFGGTFKLRIEDTDRDRSTQAAVDAILDGLSWMGLDWDGDVVYQHAQGDRHREIVETLLATGHAYRCYATPEELVAMRELAEAEKRPPIYDGRWRDRDPSEAPAGVPPAIRLKTPNTGTTTVADAVQGDVTFENTNLDDLIILRSDGSPTYNLAVVVDDHDMGVTHIVRGVDHLTNAARQSQIYSALGWDIPVFAHVPLIHGQDGAKLSKRHGALGVEAYRAMGYLPIALRSYLVRLGWSHGDEEMFSTERLIELFDLPAIGKSAARFDMAKLADLNGQFIRDASIADLTAAARSVIKERDDAETITAGFERVGWDKFDAIVPSLQERAKTLNDIVDGTLFLVAARPLTFDGKASKQINDTTKAYLGDLATQLADVSDWTVETVEAVVRAYAEAQSVGLGKIAQPLRAAMTGTTVSPPIFDVVAVLGKDEAIARLKDVAQT